MTYTLFIERKALKSLEKIPGIDRSKIIDAMELLKKNPRPDGSKKLVGRYGWRIRIGKYRVIYEIEDSVCRVIVISVGHRKEIYRDF